MNSQTESVSQTLFGNSVNAEGSHPDGRFDDNDKTLLEQYKLFVGTSEALVLRRQNVNTFFLSVNSILLAGEGLLLREDDLSSLASAAIVGIAVGGMMLCFVWRRLITSFRQLSAGKFAVIHEMETKLPARIFTAEWEVLGSGKDPKVYRPFTKVESATPYVFAIVQFVVAVVGAIRLGCGE